MKTGLDVSYRYDAEGLRLSKTVSGQEHRYVWQGSKLISEYVDGQELEFFYDESGQPYAFSYKASADAEPAAYYYVTNLQGDVTDILDANGTVVAQYTYNAWGELLASSGDLAEINPLRYRGYYFDQETGFYYVSSRYYDPAIGRWINADVFLSTGQGIVGNNMFAYCNNDPVIFCDKSGTRITSYIAAYATGQDFSFWDGVVAFSSGAANSRNTIFHSVAGLISGAYTAYSCYTKTGDLATSILCGGFSALCTTFGMSNLADYVDPGSLGILATAAMDLVFGTGYNSMVAGVYKAVTQEKPQSSSTTARQNGQKGKANQGSRSYYYWKMENILARREMLLY